MAQLRLNTAELLLDYLCGPRQALQSRTIAKVRHFARTLIQCLTAPVIDVDVASSNMPQVGIAKLGQAAHATFGYY
jgi:hypothetical protein